MKRASITAALLTVAVAVAGCGGSSGPSLSTFKSGFATDKKTFRQLGLDLQKAIVGAQGKTDAQLAAEIGALSTRARAQAASLAKLEPPSKYKADLQNLVAGFGSVATDLSQIAHAAGQHNNAAAREATQTLLKDASKIKTSDDAITAGLHLPAT